MVKWRSSGGLLTLKSRLVCVGINICINGVSLLKLQENEHNALITTPVKLKSDFLNVVTIFSTSGGHRQSTYENQCLGAVVLSHLKADASTVITQRNIPSYPPVIRS